MGQGDWLVVGAVGWLGGDAHPPPHSPPSPPRRWAELREKAGRTGARRRLGLGPRKWTMDGSSVRQDDLIGKLALWRQFPWNVSVECSQLP